MTWGRCGSLLLHRGGLSPPTSCRSPGALEPKKARNKQAESKRLRLWGGDTEECSRRGWEREPGNQIFKAFTCGVCSGMFAEQVELPRGGASFWRGGVFERSGSPRIARRVPSARPRCKRRLHRRRHIRAIWLGACASSWSLGLGVNLILHAEAGAFDDLQRHVKMPLSWPAGMPYWPRRSEDGRAGMLCPNAGGEVVP